jgi:hypothetical protein
MTRALRALYVVYARARVAALLVPVALGACTCAPPEEKKPLPAVGTLRANIVDDGVELSLETGDSRVRTLQVKVALTSATASDVVSIGDIDLVEDGIDEPKDTFTVVVADTRRVLIHEGAFARVVLADGAPTAVSLSGAIAVDDQGRKRTLKVVVP